ncbi:MAG: flavin prenyltransferase UbiX [Pirellulaceae bacterium]|nr:flavin prenyltransferase UbiX [Pirellulaceae bacterium]
MTQDSKDRKVASTDAHPIVLAMTGASGAVFSVRLLQQLLLANRHVHLVYSPSAATVMLQELKIELGSPSISVTATENSLSKVVDYYWPGTEQRWGDRPSLQQALATGSLVVHHYQDYMTPIASGSFLTSGMVICPCSGATLSGVVHAAGNNLIQRAADVHLKEHRKLILVPRETPLSVFQLDNMHRAAQAGAIVLPAMPGWYHGVESIVDIIDFIVARILDHLDVPHRLMQRWGAEE